MKSAVALWINAPRAGVDYFCGSILNVLAPWRCSNDISSTGSKLYVVEGHLSSSSTPRRSSSRLQAVHHFGSHWNALQRRQITVKQRQVQEKSAHKCHHHPCRGP